MKEEIEKKEMKREGKEVGRDPGLGDAWKNRIYGSSGPPWLMTLGMIFRSKGYSCAPRTCLLPLVPAEKTAKLSAGWNRQETLLSSLLNSSPLEMLFLGLAFQFFGKKGNNKGEDELTDFFFFCIFTENDHRQEISQWLSCRAFQSLRTSKLHNRPLSLLSQGPLQSLTWCLFLQWWQTDMC